MWHDASRSSPVQTHQPCRSPATGLRPRRASRGPDACLCGKCPGRREILGSLSAAVEVSGTIATPIPDEAEWCVPAVWHPVCSILRGREVCSDAPAVHDRRVLRCVCRLQRGAVAGVGCALAHIPRDGCRAIVIAAPSGSLDQRASGPHWAWSALAYHAAFFTRINPAAWLFAALFLVQATAFFWSGVVRGACLVRSRVRTERIFKATEQGTSYSCAACGSTWSTAPRTERRPPKRKHAWMT